MPPSFALDRHWLFALDPLHFGSGREQLTHIDLPVIREQGTGLPIAPGSSLAGSCRAYSVLARGNGNGCAGKGGDFGERHCRTCAICTAFGYSNGKTNESREGLARISSAQIVFFPIASTMGPVWITSREQLALAAISLDASVATPAPDQLKPLWQGVQANNSLLLGSSGGQLLPSCTEAAAAAFAGALGQPLVTQPLLVSHPTFINLVNDNLEVRTLVSIDPDTGAAQTGALFTYEAIPRAALLYFDITYLEPTRFGINNQTIGSLQTEMDNGLKLMSILGVGGMNARGLGRAKVTKIAAAPNA